MGQVTSQVEGFEVPAAYLEASFVERQAIDALFAKVPSSDLNLQTVNKLTKTLLDEYTGRPDIMLLPFSKFKAHGEIPRNPECSDMCVDLKEVIESGVYLIIYLSHCWEGAWDGMKYKVAKNGDVLESEVISEKHVQNWRGFPHPDTKKNEKFTLCVSGIEKIIRGVAPSYHHDNVYIWCDYSCINQDSNPAKDLRQLDKIVEMSDLMFTPVVDNEYLEWEYNSNSWETFFEDYKATAFNHEEYGYMHRAWCRLEMLYAANIPLNEHNHARISTFQAGLQVAALDDRRPHYLYGTREMKSRRGPIQLPPLAHSFLDSHLPSHVVRNLTQPSDVDTVLTLEKSIEKYYKKIEIGYKGEYNTEGQRHGKGSFTWRDGNYYDGEWKNGQMSGHGTYKNPSGDVYVGDYIAHQKDGYGKYTFANGNIYQGMYIGNRKHGAGKFTYNSGDVYEGMYSNDLRDGQGVFSWHASSTKYIGEYQNDLKHGHGTIQWSNGQHYTGGWLLDKKHGQGTMIWPIARKEGDPPSDGTPKCDTFTGEYQNDKRNGQGTFTWASGNTYTGAYANDKKSGKGKMVWSSGTTYEGDFLDDKKHGQGVMTWSTGVTYTGSFVEERRTGYGVLRNKDGILIERGIYTNDKLTEKYDNADADEGPIEGA